MKAEFISLSQLNHNNFTNQQWNLIDHSGPQLVLVMPNTTDSNIFWLSTKSKLDKKFFPNSTRAIKAIGKLKVSAITKLFSSNRNFYLSFSVPLNRKIKLGVEISTNSDIIYLLEKQSSRPTIWMWNFAASSTSRASPTLTLNISWASSESPVNWERR